MNKEPGYLRDPNFKSIFGYRAYFPLKSTLGRHGVTGEGTTTYFYDLAVVERLEKYLPEIKLLLVLRDPVDRAISQYHHFVRMGREHRSASVAIKNLLEAYEGWTEVHCLPAIPSDVAGSDYLKYGLYHHFLGPWMKFHKSNQLKVITFNSLVQNPAEVMREVFGFLQIPYYDSIDFKVFKSGMGYRDEPSIKQALTRFYEPHNQKLSELLGGDFSLN